MDPNSPTHIGRYELLDRLGEGGMGVVYLARDPLLGRTVAIKVLSVYNEELRYRFAREARSSAALKHNNIVTIYDIGDDQGRPFIAMEYLDGETMSELIRRRAPMSIVRKVQLVLELCAGLGYAHRNGIIHRDIKPANVMITADGVLKILDFGLARLATEAGTAGFTRVGALLGTPQYMSPEQIEGHTIDHRSDIFAVGLVLYEFLALRKAYTGDTPHAVLHKILSSDPQPVRELVPDIDPELEQVIAKAIEKDPKRRFQNLGLVASDLERIKNRLQTLSGDPTVRLDRSSSGRVTKASGKETPATTPRGLPNLDAIAKRRAAQIQQYLDEAQKRLDASEFDQAIEHCEAAAVIDPNDRRVLELLDRACRGAEDRRVKLWLDEASGFLSRGALSEAGKLVEQALQLRPTSPDAQGLQKEVKDRQREQERLAERSRSAKAALERARVKFGEGAYEAAIRSTNEALAYDSGNDDARALKQQAMELLAEERRKQEHEHHAIDVVAQGRMLAVAGQWDDALAVLRAFQPPHEIVDEAIAEVAREVEAMERRRFEEAEERRQRSEHEEHAAAVVVEARSLADLSRFGEAQALLRGFEPPHDMVAVALAEIEREGEEHAARQRAIEEAARRKREHQQAAEAAVAGSHALVAAEQLEQALEGLRAFQPPHVAVNAAIADVEARIEARDERRREEEAARQRAIEEARLREEEAERQRQEGARIAREREEARLREEEAARQRAIEEAARRTREHQQAAEAVVARAQLLVASGELEDALQALQGFAPAHEIVTAAIADVETRIEAREEARRREQEAERQRVEAERGRQEAARIAREREEARLREDEAARQREEEAARQRAIEEAARRTREHQQAAEAVVARAQSLVASGELEDALQTLHGFAPAHEIVTAAIADVEARIEAREEARRREQEAERQRVEAERQRQEAERVAREEAEASRRAQAEQELARRRDEELSRLQAEEEQRRREGERQRQLEELLASATGHLDAGALPAAQEAVQAALKLFKHDERARALQERLREALEAEKRHQKDKRAADTALARARKLSANGDFPAAIRALEKFQPPALVAPVLEELKTEWRAREQRREEEAARKRQGAAEAKAREEEERRQREEAAARQVEAERADKQRQLEARKQAEEEARRKNQEEETRRKAAESEARVAQPVVPSAEADEDDLQFTVFRPASIEPATWHTMLVFAHLSELPADAPPGTPSPAVVVQREATEVLGDLREHRQQTVDSLESVPNLEELTFVPHVSGVEFDPPQCAFRWMRSVHRESFRLRADESLRGQVARGRLSVFRGAIIVAEIGLTMRVASKTQPADDGKVRDSVRPYRRIFASYSHHDGAIVEELSQYARAMGDRYLQDQVDLRSGERWQTRLQDLIREADVFQLFWSWNALQSDHVRTEWEFALGLRRDSFVRPVYWEEPLPKRGALPPPELLDLHFVPIQLRARRFDVAPAALETKREPVVPTERSPIPAATPAEQAAPTPRSKPRLSRGIMAAASALALLVVAVGLYVSTGSPEAPPVAPSTSTAPASTAPATTPSPKAAESKPVEPPPPAVVPPPAPTSEPPKPLPGATAPLVIDAAPWGRVERVLDAGGKAVELPRGTDLSTPFVLDVPSGEYRVTLRGPDNAAKTASVRVSAAGGRVVVEFRKTDPADYFKRVP